MIGAFRSSHCLIVQVNSCSLSGPLLCRFPVVAYILIVDFRNFNFTIPVDDIKVKSYVKRFLDPTCVPVRILLTINLA